MSEIIESTAEADAIDLGETIDARIDAMDLAELKMWVRIMFLANQIPEYVEFVDKNIDIHIATNEKTKEVSVAVVQKPTVKEVEYTSGELGLDVAKSLKCQMLLKNSGCTRTAEVLKEIYKILGGRDENAIVTTASDSDIDKELEAIKAAEKFKV